jgi:hypothetical protein
MFRIKRWKEEVDWIGTCSEQGLAKHVTLSSGRGPCMWIGETACRNKSDLPEQATSNE